MSQIDPILTMGAEALQRAGYRITSIIRPEGRSTGHPSGRAMDIAKWHYSTSYTPADVSKVMSILKHTTHHPWIVVAEQDHIHAELSQKNFKGMKNTTTQGRLVLEKGDPIMFTPSDKMASAARKLGIAARYSMRETGDALAPPSAGTPATVIPSPAINQLAVAALSPGSTESQALSATAQANIPAAFEQAQQIAAIRAATMKAIKYIDYDNAAEISSSIGNLADMRQSDVAAVANIIAQGIPAFEPQVFDWTNVGPTTYEFFPAHAIAVGNGGPLDGGELFTLIGGLIEFTVPVITSNVGLPVTLKIDYGPTSLTKREMTVTFRLGAGNAPSRVSLIQGAQAGGFTRLQARQLTAINVAPISGASWPRYTLTNVPFAAGYLPTFRFLQPGDVSVDRFSGLLAGG